jgi:hypothetical protein
VLVSLGCDTARSGAHPLVSEVVAQSISLRGRIPHEGEPPPRAAGIPQMLRTDIRQPMQTLSRVIASQADVRRRVGRLVRPLTDVERLRNQLADMQRALAAATADQSEPEPEGSAVRHASPWCPPKTIGPVERDVCRQMLARELTLLTDRNQVVVVSKANQQFDEVIGKLNECLGHVEEHDDFDATVAAQHMCDQGWDILKSLKLEKSRLLKRLQAQTQLRDELHMLRPWLLERPSRGEMERLAQNVKQAKSEYRQWSRKAEDLEDAGFSGTPAYSAAQAEAEAANQRLTSSSSLLQVEQQRLEDLIASQFPELRLSIDDGWAQSDRVKTVFRETNFKRLYEAQPILKFQHEVFTAVQELLTAFGKTCRIPPKETDAFFEAIQSATVKAAVQDDGAAGLLNEIEQIAVRIWTAPDLLISREFCSIINQAIREDESPALNHAVVVARAMNLFCVDSARGAHSNAAWPMGPSPANPRDVSHKQNTTYRGGGLPDEHKRFFMKIFEAQPRKYRVPNFVSSSFQRHIANSFMRRPGQSLPCVLWIFEFNAALRCRHVNYVEKTLVPGEGEFLFSPYSTFTILDIVWSDDPIWTTPHIIRVRPAPDNKLEAEDLPTAPWS